MMPPFAALDLADEAATIALARALAPGLAAGDALLLDGPVGAGKSAFARALIRARLAAAGRDEDVPSPTFTLVQSYDDGQAEIWHADLYRLEGGAGRAAPGLAELGLDEAFETAICLVEWPDRLGPLAPPDALWLALEDRGGSRRRLRLSGPPAWAARLAPLLAPLLAPRLAPFAAGPAHA